MHDDVCIGPNFFKQLLAQCDSMHGGHAHWSKLKVTQWAAYTYMYMCRAIKCSVVPMCMSG